MDYTIIHKPAHTVIGIPIRTSTKGDNIKSIPAFWEKHLAEGTIDRIPGKTDPHICYGVCCDFDCSTGDFTYIIAAPSTHKGELPEGMIRREIPEADYAVFTARGSLPESIHNAFNYIYGEWLPASEYERDHKPEFEYYDGRRMTSEHAEVDIYVPVVKKT